MIDYKGAEKLVDELEERKELLREARKKQEEAEYKVSIHYRVEQLLLLIDKLSDHFPRGRWSDHKLETIIINLNRSSDWFKLKIKSAETIPKKKWLFKWEDPVWQKKISWFGRNWRADSKDKKSSFYNDLVESEQLSETDSLELLELVEKEVFDYILSQANETGQVFESTTFYCSQCGFSLEREVSDKFCSNCGNKFV